MKSYRKYEVSIEETLFITFIALFDRESCVLIAKYASFFFERESALFCRRRGGPRPTVLTDRFVMCRKLFVFYLAPFLSFYLKVIIIVGY